MSNPKKTYLIVVGIDYSPASDLALERAFELATARPPAEVHVVSVINLYGAQAIAGGYGPQGIVAGSAEPVGMNSVTLAEATSALERYVEQRRSSFQGALDSVGVRCHLRLDAPATEVAQMAADLEADLVVVGTHGRRGIARLLLGSVAEAVVRLAPCPVLVVRPKALPEQPPRIEPPCPQCLAARQASAGAEFWCEQHRERHGQRHTYNQRDRVGAETEMPLTFHG